MNLSIRPVAALALGVLVTLGAAACATNNTNPANYASDDATPDPTQGGSSATKPSCGAIDDACDGPGHDSGLAKECHDFASKPGSTEEVCSARKAECVQACQGSGA